MSEPEPRQPDGVPRTNSSATWAAAVLAAITGYVLFLRLPLIDDAHIAMCYGRTLAESGTWGMLPGQTANSATSPLNVVALALAGAPTGDYALGAEILAILSFWAVYLSGTAIARDVPRTFGGRAVGAVLAVAVAANPSVLAAVGLEGPIVAALMCGVAWTVAADRPSLCGALLALLVLARMDTLLFALIVAAVRAVRREPLRPVLAAFLAVAAPWFLFSWVRLGSFVPDTFFLKTAQRWGAGLGFLDGPALYWRKFPLPAAASVLLAPAVPFAFAAPGAVRRIAWMLAAYAAASFAAYALLGPPPCPWYFLQQVIPLAIAGALGVAEAARRFGRAAFLLGLAPAAFLAAAFSARPFPAKEQLINVNWATPERYAEIGRAIAERTPPGDAIEASSEIGTLAYFSRRRLVNEFSDRARAQWIIDRAHYAGRDALPWLVAFNFRWRPDEEPVAARWKIAQTPRVDDPALSSSPDEWDSWTRWQPHSRIVLTKAD